VKDEEEDNVGINAASSISPSNTVTSARPKCYFAQEA
jgi:hypothetical protein